MLVRIGLALRSDHWDVEVVWEPAGGSKTRTFTAVKLDHTPWLRPGPNVQPAAEDPDHDVLSGASDDLEPLTRRVSELGGTTLEPRDSVAYGRLLFESVLAPVWDTIVKEAKAKGELIELALRLPPGKPPLQTVLWELMHDGKGFLVTHADVDVALTRRIDADTSTPAKITPPARVLFAIGAELSDPGVRAGAEFLGLMRELERSGSRIASYVLEDASAGRVEDAVKHFRPDVVHFIAHGRRNAAGMPGLILRPEDAGVQDEHVTAERLYSCIAAGSKKPAMVVLAACESGAVSAVQGMPLAEELVVRGVPVAVAMAGSVTDQACRLFTRRFGTALASGGPLLRAVADARLAAYRRGTGPPSTSIDWALPSIFLADGVDHDYRPVAAETGVPMSKRVEKYDFAEGPVFCARQSFLVAYDQLMSDDPLSVLAIYTPGNKGGFGKSRIVRELGTRALLDGHIPCVVGLDGRDRPTDPRRFAEAMFRAIVQARRLFQLRPPESLPALLDVLAPPNAAVPRLERAWRPWRRDTNALLADYREDGRPLDRDSLAGAIADDLADLIEDARAGNDPRIGDHSRAIVLLDTVETWADTVELLTTGLVTQHGLGDEDESVPVVMTFRAGAGTHDTLFEGLIEFADGKVWIDATKLDVLSEGNEEGLAYRWILLNANPKVSPPFSKQVYTVVKPDGQWRSIFRLATDGLPVMLSDVKFYGAARVLLDLKEIEPGDDDKALADLIESRT